MRIKTVYPGLFLTSICLSIPALSTELNESSFIAEGLNKIENQTVHLRLTKSDLKISKGWDVPHPIPVVEGFFARPFQVPQTGSQWADAVENSQTPASLYQPAFDILISSPSTKPTAVSSFQGVLPIRKIPSQLSPTIVDMITSILSAQTHLTTAVHSISAEDRTGFLSLCDFPTVTGGVVTQEISSRRTKKRYEAMRSFSQDDMLLAGHLIMSGLDKILPALRNQTWDQKRKVRFRTQAGDVLIGSSGDDRYRNKDLKDVVLLIDLGGNNTYEGDVAVARENEIRVVIDLGTRVTTKADPSSFGNAGCGVFGLGVFVLPNEKGTHSISGGSFSQGCGVAGLGALLIEGTAELKGERMTQGAAAFGIGLLSVHGHDAVITASRMGQGFAMVRGVGILQVHGDRADIKGGLVQPDPREPQGSVSMCQGVGFGARAYSGGGVGIAVISGNHAKVLGSYFAQGCGYWHSFGVFRARGDRNHLQARRYDMGSGVHSSFGHFEVLGDSNRILNWGVGPAYGWDRSVGSAFVRGQDNEIQVDWATGVGSIGSVSLAYYKTDNSRFKACDLGEGHFGRSEASYSMQVIEGVANKIQCLGEAELQTGKRTLLRNTRGVLAIENAEFVGNLKLVPPEWPAMPQETELKQELVNLQRVMKDAAEKSPVDEVSDLLDVAAAFSLDKKTPREALGRLVTLPPEKVPVLVQILDPVAIDQLIQLNYALPAHGDNAFIALIENWDADPMQRKLTILNFLRLYRPSLVFPFFGLNPPDDSRLRLAMLKTMALMLNKDAGNETGLRSSLLAVLETVKNPTDEKKKTEAIELLKKMFFGDGFGLLATCSDLTVEQRKRFLAAAPQDLSFSLDENGAKTFLEIINENRALNQNRIEQEIETLNLFEPHIRTECMRLVKSTQTNEAYGATVALGQIAHPDDLSLLTDLFQHESSVVREAAAVAVGRMGEKADEFLKTTLRMGPVRSRKLAALTIQHNLSKNTLPLLRQALSDPDPGVRLIATAIANELPDLLRPQQAEIRKMFKARLKSEKDPNVRLAITLLD